MSRTTVILFLVLTSLSFGNSIASIKNDTLFTSPNENTALVQQFIDSLVSVDTDYIVHVKKIDNSTSQTLYSNYILWADISVKVANKYGIKELDKLKCDNNIISIHGNTFSRQLDYGLSLFNLLNTHQNTFFENDSIKSIPITQKTDCIIKVEMRNSGKTLKLEFPCDLDFNSEYYSKLSGSLFYPIYLLTDKEIVSYLDIQDFYTRLYGNKEENEADDLKDQIRNAKFKMKYNEELLQRVKSFIYDKSNDTINKEFVVYTPLPNWENTDSLFVDSLCRSGVEDIIVDYKHMGWSWNDHPDTTRDASGFSTNILWHERNSKYIKVKFFSKLYESPTYLFEHELFSFLDNNNEILSDNVLNSFNNYKESALWKEEDSLIKAESEKKWKDTINYPISIDGTIIVYADKMVEVVTICGGSGSDLY